MKNIRLTSVLIGIATLINAQDIIVKNDSSKIESKVFEVTSTEISYKLHNYSNGPMVYVLTKNIAYIKYSNGTTDFFNKSTQFNNEKTSNNTNGYYDLNLLESQPNIENDKKLYTYKNYLGVSMVAFLNNSFGLSYMRDIKKLNLIPHISVSVGYDKPVVTKGLYSGAYISEASDKFTYDRMNYQIAVSPLFTPSFKGKANFLVGPSMIYSEFKVSTELNYTDLQTGKSGRFTNSFKLHRRNYGINVGFISRINNRFNMTAFVTLGYKLDSYSQPDAFGTKQLDDMNVSYSKNSYAEGHLYANLFWTFGYRF